MVKFERAFVISLSHRKERLEEFRREVSKVQSVLPEVELWPGIIGDICQPPPFWSAGAGAWGCMRSHVGIMEYCLNNRVGSYVVFEDDAKFKSTFCEYVEAVEMPDGWEQLYLGGQLMHTHSHKPVRVSDRLHRPFNVNRTHAFAVSRAGMLKLYQHCCSFPYVPKEHIDHHLGRLHEDRTTQVYCLSHWQVGQHGSPSSVSGKHEPVTYYEDAAAISKDHWLHREPVVILLRGTKNLADQCAEFLHVGNTINEFGYDTTLDEATRYAYPGKHLGRWFGWLVGEIASEGSNRLPCAYHPQVTVEMLRKYVAPVVVEVDHCSSADEVKSTIMEALPQWKG